MDELRDIKPIVDYQPAWPWWAWVLLVAPLVIGLLVWFLRRRRSTPQVAIDPNHAALVALDALTGLVPADRESARRLQTQLSMILRRWVEARWALRATDMTTEEIAVDAGVASSLGVPTREALLEALMLADRVRYADVELAAVEHVAAVARARTLVAGT